MRPTIQKLVFLSQRIPHFKIFSMATHWRKCHPSSPNNDLAFICIQSYVSQLFEENRTNSDPIKQVVVSKVMGATLGEPNGHIHFVDGKVEILLSTLNLNLYEVDRTSARCAYWNVSTQDWSFDGCEVVETNGKIENLHLQAKMY